MKKQKSPLRRAILATLALGALAAPPVASGCAAGFAPISQVSGLRVLAVVADEPYAHPGDQVTFTMTYADSSPLAPRPLEIVWLSGCVNPVGDEYYGCYAPLAAGLSGLGSVDPGHLPAGVGLGTTFTMTLPEDLISSRAVTPGVAPYGIAFVFFVACAGNLGPVPPDGSGLAGSFPIGCFDADGNPLDADSFVPGYTQVYAFKDGRTNQNPPVNLVSDVPGSVGGIIVQQLDSHGDAVDGGAVGAGEAVTACPITEAARLAAGGCGKTDPFRACTEYQITVDVPDDVAELDPSSTDTSGKELHEEVWVDYFADNGDIDSPLLLVNDATTGLQRTVDAQGNQMDSFSTRWIAPPLPPVDGGTATATATLWAVLHDSRGGETVVSRTVTVH